MILFMKVTKFSEFQFDRYVIIAIGDEYMVFWIEYLLVVVLAVDVNKFTAKLS